MLHDGKELGKALLLDSVPRFIGLPNIKWAWGEKSFCGGIFGSQLGPDHTFFGAGMHELAYCVDFVKRGIHSDRMTMFGLHFKRPKAHYWRGQTYYNDPKGADATLCEIRTFATQMILMEQAFGEIYQHMSHWDCERAGYEVDANKFYEISVDPEHFAQDAADVFDVMEDKYEFNRRYQGKYKAHEDAIKDRNEVGERIMFEKIMFAYNAMNTPYGLRRIARALKVVDHRCAVIHRQVIRQNEIEMAKARQRVPHKQPVKRVAA